MAFWGRENLENELKGVDIAPEVTSPSRDLNPLIRGSDVLC
jgi:hypothetical protein